ncbi:hypothetical protein [Bacillus sp. FSL K6-3431]|uniref:hypothetical protein n=1 Tax=Bacillus sp. FSL K6-3431 TaxID=2921500 RepID=UPI0030F63B40
MDFLKYRFYIELLAISFGIVSLVYVIPVQIYFEGQPRFLTIIISLFLWYVIITKNETFHELLEKWMNK